MDIISDRSYLTTKNLIEININLFPGLRLNIMKTVATTMCDNYFLLLHIGANKEKMTIYLFIVHI